MDKLINFANRTCADLEIRFLETMKLFLDADWANVTAVSVTGDSVYAMKKGSRAVAFANPIEATMRIEAQVLPFKAYALFSDGTISDSAIRPFREVVKCDSAGSVTITSMNVVAGTVEAFAEEDPETALTGVTVEGQTVSCESFTQESNYIVRGLMTVSASVQTVSFNNKKLPKDYFITMTTQDKGEDGSLVDKQITAYKATPKRNFELSLSSTGDPVTVTMEFDCMEDKDGNQLDMSVFED